MPDPVEGLPYITEGLPGIGGYIKHRDEDFLVDEVPAYEPCGEGEHCYLLVEKRGLSTMEMVGIVARHFGVKPEAVGYAGMKDKHAVTRQVVSVHTPGRNVDDFPMLEHPSIGILWADMHANKLRIGHLKGNRFSVKIRGVSAMQVIAARAVLEQIEKTGMPNYYGPQRFGGASRNHEIGRLDIIGHHKEAVERMMAPHPQGMSAQASRMYTDGRYADAASATLSGQHAERAVLRALADGKSPASAIRAVGKVQRRFFLSAFQSALFNHVCAARLEARTLDKLFEGDLAFKHDNHACFAVTENEIGTPGGMGELRARLDRFEISPSGPMWGPDMTRTTGEPGELEDEVLERSGVTLTHLERHSKRLGSRLRGARRPLRVPVTDPIIDSGTDEVGHYVRLAFELPTGSFATTLCREIIKDGPRLTPGTVFEEPTGTREHAEDHDE